MIGSSRKYIAYLNIKLFYKSLSLLAKRDKIEEAVNYRSRLMTSELFFMIEASIFSSYTQWVARILRVT